MQILIVLVIVTVAGFFLLKRFQSAIKSGECGCGCDNCGASCSSIDYVKAVEEHEEHKKQDTEN